MTSYAGGAPNLTPDPVGSSCYSNKEVSILAKRERECSLLEKNIKTMEEQYQKCRDGSLCKEELHNDRVRFWATAVGAFVVGFLAGGASR